MEPRSWRLLLISDDETDQAVLRELLATLTEAPPVLDCIPHRDSGTLNFASNPYDACLIAECPEPHDTLDKVRACAARGYRAAFILWLRYSDRDLGRAAMTAGALDYLVREQTDTALLERSLRTAIARKRAEVGLLQTSADLLACRRELEQRLFQTTILGEMVSLLQTCQNTDEAFAIVTCSAAKLFPTEAGGLYVFGEGLGQLHAAAVWGVGCSAIGEFAREDCWALRRGRMHLVPDAATGLLCGHVGTPLPASCLCVPMMTQGEAVGVLHLQAHDQAALEAREGDHLPEAKQRLAQIVAEQLALALANLKLRQTLREQSIRDPLTGLFNRRHMQESLEREVCRAGRRMRPLGVIMLDLDHFKHYNDTFGHEAGDMLLRAMGHFLHTHIRGEDIACRYGGEEFLLILTDSTLEDTRRRAEELREGIKFLEVQCGGRPLERLSASLGVAIFPDQGDTAETLVRAADTALYQAKADGRDRVVVAQSLPLPGPHFSRLPSQTLRKR